MLFGRFSMTLFTNIDWFPLLEDNNIKGEYQENVHLFDSNLARLLISTAKSPCVKIRESF